LAKFFGLGGIEMSTDKEISDAKNILLVQALRALVDAGPDAVLKELMVGGVAMYASYRIGDVRSTDVWEAYRNSMRNIGIDAILMKIAEHAPED
jgi:hypothetical protein